ncbi:E3 ubiquitin-protein ligase RNF128 isoform X3 [Myotis myotis]|uniref:E3 ubiquitin-protein ligase RNF128 isoform X3 n=1 Tax=Myotis myotis TaxID=51298 RepID=UPI00174B830E|nr:E3 ubiquitin-protein ligase RNF128 isoform X3 [Myotis myotis]XP_059535926.1 E3 ubiquitin-protein ligase RNF128 isoform X4 [Myotis daubentonii]
MGPPPGAGVSYRGSCGFSRLLAWCFLLALSPQAPGSRGAEAVWTAYLNVSWRVPHTGVNRTVWELSEEGVYGQDSPLEPVAGVLVPPDGPGALNACNPHTNFTVPTVPGDWGRSVHVSWLALIQRGGGCTFADKIHLAQERGASGAVIFNFPGTRNEVIPMSHPGAGDIVAIMIGNLKGTKILQSIQRGIQVTMVIEVGKKHGPWVNHYSIFLVSVSFFIITAATVGYFIFYSARRLRNARAQNRKQRQLKADAKKAIGRLQLRTLKQGDKEIGPDGDSCAVCIELYKPNDLVRILTCKWILKMDQCLYKSLYPMKLLIVPLLMKKIIAVRLHHLDMLQFREQMNRLWRNMCSQQMKIYSW